MAARTFSSQQSSINVAVPVRDERRRLPALLSALDRQVGINLSGLKLFLLFDGCTDGGADYVRASVRRYRYAICVKIVERSKTPNAGRARKLAMALALADMGERDEEVLLTTDADTVPADNWCFANALSLANADVVAGAIFRGKRRPNQVRDRMELCVERIHKLRRQIDPLSWEGSKTHGTVGGASLGFTRRSYEGLGGFPPIQSGEDRAIVRAARREGFKVRQDSNVRVTTSSRRIGRAIGGLADALRKDLSARSAYFTDPDAAVAHYGKQAAARTAFDGHFGDPRSFAQLAGFVGIPAAAVSMLAATSPNAEAFVHRLLPDSVELDRVPLAEAERKLDALEDSVRRLVG